MYHYFKNKTLKNIFLGDLSPPLPRAEYKLCLDGFSTSLTEDCLRKISCWFPDMKFRKIKRMHYKSYLTNRELMEIRHLFI